MRWPFWGVLLRLCLSASSVFADMFSFRPLKSPAQFAFRTVSNLSVKCLPTQMTSSASSFRLHLALVFFKEALFLAYETKVTRVSSNVSPKPVVSSGL